MNKPDPKKIAKLKLIAELESPSEVELLKYVDNVEANLENKIEKTTNNLNSKLEEVKNSFPTFEEVVESILIPEDGEQGIQGEKGERGEKGEKGDTVYVDKIIEKLTERIEVIKEQPIVTEITKVEIKEVAIPQTPDETIDKINASLKFILKERVEGLSEIERLLKLNTFNPTMGPSFSDLVKINARIDGLSTTGGASPLTTKGDLYGFSTLDARVPVGTNGQVLSADSTQTTGLKWITVSGTGTVTSVASADGSITVSNPTTVVDLAVVKAPKWTTARTLAGNSVDGSANVAFSNKFIVQGTADAGLSGAQFLGALGTGILKNTTTTGVLSIATGADLPAMTATVGGAVPTPPNNTTTFLRGDGTFATPTASATPAGSDTQIQYNNAGALGASSGLTFDGTQTLTLSGTAPVFQMTDTTASAKSLRLVVDANKASWYEAAGAAGDLITLDLTNKRFGFGISAPGVAFDVVGLSRFSRNSIAATSTSGLIINNSTLATAGVPNQWSPSLFFQASVYDVLQSNFANWKVEIKTSGTGTGSGSGRLAFSYGYGPTVTGFSELVSFDGFTGNVGINTSTPTKKFDVNGDTNITGVLKFTNNVSSSSTPISIENNLGTDQLKLNGGTGGFQFRNSADSGDAVVINNGGDMYVGGAMTFGAGSGFPQAYGISNNSYYGGHELQFNAGSNDGFLFRDSTNLVSFLRIDSNGTGGGGTLTIIGSTPIYPAKPVAFVMPIDHWISDSLGNQRILFDFQNDGQTYIKGGEVYGSFGDHPNISFFDQNDVLLHDFRNTGEVHVFEGITGNNYNFFNVNYDSGNNRVLIQTPQGMPTSDPGDGKGTLWYDGSNIVYRGT